MAAARKVLQVLRHLGRQQLQLHLRFRLELRARLPAAFGQLARFICDPCGLNDAKRRTAQQQREPSNIYTGRRENELFETISSLSSSVDESSPAQTNRPGYTESISSSSSKELSADTPNSEQLTDKISSLPPFVFDHSSDDTPSSRHSSSPSDSQKGSSYKVSRANYQDDDSSSVTSYASSASNRLSESTSGSRGSYQMALSSKQVHRAVKDARDAKDEPSTIAALQKLIYAIEHSNASSYSKVFESKGGIRVLLTVAERNGMQVNFLISVIFAALMLRCFKPSEPGGGDLLHRCVKHKVLQLMLSTIKGLNSTDPEVVKMVEKGLGVIFQCLSVMVQSSPEGEAATTLNKEVSGRILTLLETYTLPHIRIAGYDFLVAAALKGGSTVKALVVSEAVHRLLKSLGKAWGTPEAASQKLLLSTLCSQSRTAAMQMMEGVQHVGTDDPLWNLAIEVCMGTLDNA